MATKTLAVQYRPDDWEQVAAQDSTKKILMQQIETGSVKNAYLFCGASGCGKTTLARIFANKVNKGAGAPIEIDAASNSGVDNIRDLNQTARRKSLDSEYKVIIIDECHSLSSASWQAMLKTLEDCPKYTIFILCTTNPEKIPATVLNRVQQYTFTKIPHELIMGRLQYICKESKITAEEEALSFITKQANGGMRDAIAMLDKAAGLSAVVDVESVSRSLGVSNTEIFMGLLGSILDKQPQKMIDIIESVNADGKDLKLFLKQFQAFIVDVCKYCLFDDLLYTNIPPTVENKEHMGYYKGKDCYEVLDVIMQLSNTVKWDTAPLSSIEAVLLLFLNREA